MKATAHILAPLLAGLLVSDRIPLRAETLDTWQWRSPLPQGNPLHSLAYGNGTYVAVGDYGTILTSSSGLFWTVRSLETTNTLTGVAFGDGLFVAVGYESFFPGPDVILTSTNGVDWVHRSTGATNALQSIAWGDGRFVAVGSGCFYCGPYGPGAIVTSTNGLDWTPGTPATNGLLTAVTHQQGLFVAVGYATIQYSTDGLTWWRALAPDCLLQAVTYGNARFVAVGRTMPAYPGLPQPVALSSTNGRDWTPGSFTPPPDPGLPIAMKTVAGGAGRFVALGSSGSSNLRWVSSDGVTWTERPGLAVLEWPTSLLWAGGQFVAVGDYGGIAVSTGGENWTLVCPATSNNLRGAAYGNSRFVAVGNSGMTAVSDDGMAWDWQRAPTSVNLHDVTFASNQFIAVGSDGTILSAPDGTAWALQSSGTTEDLFGIAAGNGVWVAVGGDKHGDCDDGCWFSHALLSSPDGIHWTDRLPGFLNIRFHGVAFGNGVFVAVGGPRAVYTSTNGVDWAGQNAGTWAYLKGVAFGNGVFVAVGEGTQAWNEVKGIYEWGNWIFTSTNGVNWTSNRPPANVPSFELDEVSFGEGTFVAVGNSGVILTSADGRNWTQRHSPTATNLRGLTYGNGTFVIVGNNDTILQNGTNATPHVSGFAVQPESQVAAPGSSVVLHVEFLANVPLTYQWRRNGTNIPGATQPVLALSNAQYSDTGFYSVQVSHSQTQWLSTTASVLVTLADPLDTWHSRMALSGHAFSDVAWGNGLFVAVGNAGEVYTSPDGVNWTNRNSNTTRPLQAIAYGGGQFVAAGGWGGPGAIITSPDGIAWTPRASGTNQSFLWAVGHRDGFFVVVGENGAILTSPDGVNWTDRSVAPPPHVLYAVTYGQGLFVAVGTEHLSLTSTDGMRWSSGDDSAGAQTLFGTTWDGERFLAVGSSGLIVTSADGLTWRPRPSGVTAVLIAVTSGFGRAVAVGEAGTILSSPDGVTWTRHNSGTSSSMFWGVACGGSTFVAVGTSGLILQSDPLVPVPPAIMQQPANQLVRLGYGFTNRVVATGSPLLSYQWRRNETDLPGATNSTFAVTNASWADDGDYSVTVVNPVGAVTSVVASVRIGQQPTILVQPLNQSIVRGGSATLSLLAAGTPVLAFRWVRNGVTAQYEQSDGPMSFFTVTNVQGTNTIRVAVTNQWGSVLSAFIKISPLDDTDGDGMPDEWETLHGLDANDPADAAADLDRDGAGNLAEYQSGTDCRDSASALRLRLCSVEPAVLNFTIMSNKTCTVQYVDVLDGRAWERLADYVARETNRFEILTDPHAAGQSRFYRVVTPWIPNQPNYRKR